MFNPNSRYANAGTYTIRDARGQTQVATRLPVRPQPPLRGFHRRTVDQRLDLIAAQYVADATAFWRLCDATGAIAPDACGARDLIAIPAKA